MHPCIHPSGKGGAGRKKPLQGCGPRIHPQRQIPSPLCGFWGLNGGRIGPLCLFAYSLSPFFGDIGKRREGFEKAKEGPELKSPNQSEIKMKDAKKMMEYFTPSEAAAVAVVVTTVRERRLENAHVHEVEAAYEMLLELEKAAVDSIQANDGRTTHWLIKAAKQINPLLS
jgi:hypothetical protein